SRAAAHQEEDRGRVVHHLPPQRAAQERRITVDPLLGVLVEVAVVAGDGEPTFLRCSLWREHGENFAESHEKGDRVIVVGKLQQNEFTDKEGNERTTLELNVEEAGPALRFATAEVTRRKGNGNRTKSKAKATASAKAGSGDDDSGDDDFDF